MSQVAPGQVSPGVGDHGVVSQQLEEFRSVRDMTDCAQRDIGKPRMMHSAHEHFPSMTTHRAQDNHAQISLELLQGNI